MSNFLLSGIGSVMAVSHLHLTYMTFFLLKHMNISEGVLFVWKADFQNLNKA